MDPPIPLKTATIYLGIHVAIIIQGCVWVRIKNLTTNHWPIFGPYLCRDGFRNQIGYVDFYGNS